MKIVKIAGGLGNQMFQYAFARELEKRTGDEVSLDVSTYRYMRLHNGFELGRIFPVRYREAEERDIERLATRPRGFFSKVRRKYFTRRTHYIDRVFRYDERVFDLKGDRYFEGWWQSEKYFSDITSEIRAELRFMLPPGERNANLIDELKRRGAQPVSLHVRRGDFLKLPETMVCGTAYYHNAIAKMKTIIERPLFLVFSDDIPWCDANLPLEKDEVMFVDWNRGADSWRDMWLMQSCDAHIVANSSFSWWGAWLDSSSKPIVVAPDKWSNAAPKPGAFYHYDFGDIVPPGWIRVQTGGVQL